MDHDEPAQWPSDGYTPDEGGGYGDPGDDPAPGLEFGVDDFDHSLDHDVDSTDDYDDDPLETAELTVDDPSGDTGFGDDFPAPAVETDDGSPSDSLAVDWDVQDAAPGTDPDLIWLADDEVWTQDPFPETLDLDQPPEPVDGMPWSDPELLGTGDTPPPQDPLAGYHGSAAVTDLYAYDATEPVTHDADPWVALAGSEDPATSSLAQFWAPGDRLR